MPKENPLLAYGRYGAVGLEFAATTLAGILVGRYADTMLGTEPWFMVLGALAGLAGAIFRLIVVLRKFSDHAYHDREN